VVWPAGTQRHACNNMKVAQISPSKHTCGLGVWGKIDRDVLWIYLQINARSQRWARRDQCAAIHSAGHIDVHA
jgi:hypothetical protein